MTYKWKPSKEQRREFAKRMNDDYEFKEAYLQRRREAEQKRRSTSMFEYESAGGQYIPTKEQHDFCFNNIHLADTSEKKDAFNQVMYGYSCQEKVHHDHIHIVNEERRKYA